MTGGAPEEEKVDALEAAAELAKKSSILNRKC